MGNRRTNQGGSVATYILIGLILIAGLLGSVYFVKLRGDQARKDQAIASLNKQPVKPPVAQKSADKDEESTDNTPASSNDNKSVTSAEPTANSKDLPNTGSNLAVGDLLATFMLTVAIIGYISSRRTLNRSL